MIEDLVEGIYVFHKKNISISHSEDLQLLVKYLGIHHNDVYSTLIIHGGAIYLPCKSIIKGSAMYENTCLNVYEFAKEQKKRKFKYITEYHNNNQWLTTISEKREKEIIKEYRFELTKARKLKAFL